MRAENLWYSKLQLQKLRNHSVDDKGLFHFSQVIEKWRQDMPRPYHALLQVNSYSWIFDAALRVKILSYRWLNVL